LTATTAVRDRSKLTLPGEPFTLEHFAAWAGRHELDNDEPWLLDEFERRFAEDVFAGFPICWLVVPEGNGKTTFVAGLADYVIEFKESAYVPVAASSRDQAEWIYRQAEGFVYRGNRDDVFTCLEGYRRIRCDGMGSRIQVFAADDRSGDGIIPGGIAVLDELHRHRDLKLYETWKGKLKKRDAQIVVISTAGEVGSEFEEERTRLRQEATVVQREGCFTRAESWLGDRRLSVLHDWAVPEDGDLDDLGLVKQANPASSITVESLTEKRAMVRNDQHWSRFTCNRSARSIQAAIAEKEWFGAESKERIPEGSSVVAGLDLGWKYDTTALVPLWVRDQAFRLFGAAEILTPPRDGTLMSPRLVEEAIMRVHRRNPIRMLVMDMTDGAQLASWCTDELGIPVMDRGQTRSFQVMDYARFTEALREGWLYHSGDPGLTRHVLNAVAKVLPGGDIVFERPSSSRGGSGRVQQSREVDALDAATMAHTFAAAELTTPASDGWRGL
jgi:phage terminase large subunit-like protein